MHTGAALIAEGRANTLAQWIDALPETVRERHPRLALYLGVALLYCDPQRAKQLLDAAYDGFVAAGDVRRVLMTAAHAVDCHYFEWADFTALDRWIAVFEQHLTPAAPLDAPYDAMRVHSAFLIALLFRQPDHPRIAEIAGEVARQIAGESALDVPLNFRLNAASILFNYYNWKTKGDTADALIARVTPWLADPRATPVNRVWWRVHLSFNHQILGRFDAGETDDGRGGGDRARARAALDAVRDLLRGSRADRGVARRRRLDRRARETAHACSIRRGGWTSRTSASRNRRCAARRTPDDALRAAQDAVAIGREAGLPAMQIPHFLVREALSHLHARRVDDALARYDEAMRVPIGVDADNFRVQRGFVARASRTLDRRMDEAVDAVARVVARVPRAPLPRLPAPVAGDRWRRCWRWRSSTASSPNSRASLIRERQLAAPSPTTAHWPWPLALRTLGDFVVIRDGVPLVSKGKAQKRPLEMLKALVASAGATSTRRC